mmetsp:Transcript_50903/g.143054  ORF Transcript_50903/g.143054 Transcript_50903/m.143054 type:complete len:565 (-) Transcript_50903:7-1701(-)
MAEECEAPEVDVTDEVAEAVAEVELEAAWGEVGDVAVDEEELQKLEAQLVGSGEVPQDGLEDDEEAPGEGDEAPVDAVSEAEGDEPEPDEEVEEHMEGVEVEEHLKDAVEGSLRLKRMLSRDEDTPTSKRPRLSPEEEAKKAKTQQLLLKWGLQTDAVCRHVCETCTLEELDAIYKSGYCPDKSNVWKSPSEIFARYCAEQRERLLPGGAACDPVSAFKHRFGLDLTREKLLRALSHKDLRYVITTYDGTQDLQELVTEAAACEAEDDNTAASALPDSPGVATLGRFTRLELFDPVAHAGVFGDANLTFAIKLVRHRKALGHVGRVVATTFEEIDILRERYKEIDESIQVLEEHFAEVYHGVDCTRVAIDERFKGMEGCFGAVYYNFPHSGAIQGFFDGHPVVNWRHENLMRLFFRALRSFMKPGGIVKVASNMGAVGVRYSYIIGSALENEFAHIETVPFLEWHLHRYGRSYGDKRDIYKRPDAKNNQSYNAQSAERDMVYCFCYAPTGEPLPRQTVKLPPSLKTLKACADGPFRKVAGHARENLAKQLHKRFVTEISGTHVG